MNSMYASLADVPRKRWLYGMRCVELVDIILAEISTGDFAAKDHHETHCYTSCHAQGMANQQRACAPCPGLFVRVHEDTVIMRSFGDSTPRLSCSL